MMASKQLWILHDGDMIKPFSISARVCQGYLLNTFLFLMVLDWVSHQAFDDSVFTYLGSFITTTGGTEENVEPRCEKAEDAFSILRTFTRKLIFFLRVLPV